MHLQVILVIGKRACCKKFVTFLQKWVIPKTEASTFNIFSMIILIEIQLNYQLLKLQ